MFRKKLREWYILTWILSNLTVFFLFVLVFFLSMKASYIWEVYRFEFSRVLRKSNSFISVQQISPSYYCQKPRSWKWFGWRPSVIETTAGKVKYFIMTLIFQMSSSLNGWSNLDTGCQGWLWSLGRQLKEFKELSLLMWHLAEWELSLSKYMRVKMKDEHKKRRGQRLINWS